MRRSAREHAGHPLRGSGGPVAVSSAITPAPGTGSRGVVVVGSQALHGCAEQVVVIEMSPNAGQPTDACVS